MLMLSACTTAPPSAPAPIIWNTCETPTACHLVGTRPKTNGDFQLAYERAVADWADCAAKVEAHITCNQKAT
ncbi:Rz1-like lysis system protein LysC, partial [Cellvibrio mixtus]|uniref:Rz1-like lysis system protein LysC n=1 Tax=Cellvibrio mixtus TaxID=39650 RepID=UPI0039966769